MPDILYRLPVTQSSHRLALPGGSHAIVRMHQIIVWISLSPPDLDELPPGASRFPAVVDTGCGYPLVLHQTHWTNWVGMERARLQRLPDGSVYRRPAKRYDADVWIFRNRPDDYSDILPELKPFRLELDDTAGVTVSDVDETARFGIGEGIRGTSTPMPRLPLIGLPALELNHLILTVDAGRRLVRLRQPRKWWFLRW